jgi:hypothetical protein
MPDSANVFTHGSSTSRPFDNGLNAMADPIQAAVMSQMTSLSKRTVLDLGRSGEDPGRGQTAPGDGRSIPMPLPSELTATNSFSAAAMLTLQTPRS